METKEVRAMKRFELRREGNGWRVTDTKTGRVHSARIQDKARAQRQVDTMNERIERVTKGAK